MFDHLFFGRSGCESTSTSGRCNVGVLNLNDLAQYSEAAFRSRGTEIGLRNRWAEVGEGRRVLPGIPDTTRIHSAGTVPGGAVMGDCLPHSEHGKLQNVRLSPI